MQDFANTLSKAIYELYAYTIHLVTRFVGTLFIAIVEISTCFHLRVKSDKRVRGFSVSNNIFLADQH
jgi:hypothetical protein